jgi:hypothetical protein
MFLGQGDLCSRSATTTALFSWTSFTLNFRYPKFPTAISLVGGGNADISFGVIHDRAKRSRAARQLELPRFGTSPAASPVSIALMVLVEQSTNLGIGRLVGAPIRFSSAYSAARSRRQRIDFGNVPRSTSSSKGLTLRKWTPEALSIKQESDYQPALDP